MYTEFLQEPIFKNYALRNFNEFEILSYNCFDNWYAVRYSIVKKEKKNNES